MKYRVTVFYLDEDGQECPCAESFSIGPDDAERCRRDAQEAMAAFRRPGAPAYGTRPDGFRIEDDEGAIVLRYIAPQIT
jgi:hypothetical protein